MTDSLNLNLIPTVIEPEIIREETEIDPDFKTKIMDTGHLAPTDSYWNPEISGRRDGNRSNAEVLNFALFRPRYGTLLTQSLGIEVPWMLTAEETSHPRIVEKLKLIDDHIAEIKRIITDENTRSRKSDQAIAQKKTALALYAFCLFGKNNDLNASLTIMLQENELNSYIPYLQKTGGLGMGDIIADFNIEGKIANVLLENGGLCTEQSYLYFFIANRAGLDVRFSRASMSEGGYVNHVLNEIQLTDGNTLRVDLAQRQINGTYPFYSPIDPVQMLADFYRNLATDIWIQTDADTMQPPPPLLEPLMLATVELDPLHPENHSQLAAFYESEYARNMLIGDGTSANEFLKSAAKHYQLSMDNGGSSNTMVLVNVAEFYRAHPEFGDALPHYQHAYEILTAHRDKTGLIFYDATEALWFARIAYRTNNFRDCANTYSALQKSGVILNDEDRLLLAEAEQHIKSTVHKKDIN